MGLKSQVGSIYNVVTEDTKCYIWKANVIAEIEGKMLTIVFTWNGDPFNLKLSLIKSDYYDGKIFLGQEEWGRVYLWQYKKGDEIILKGDFDEFDYPSECFIELRPIKN